MWFSIVSHAKIPSVLGILVYRLDTSRVTKMAPSSRASKEDKTLRNEMCLLYRIEYL